MVESTALEMRRTGNRTVGSNPTLSANFPNPATGPIRFRADSARVARVWFRATPLRPVSGRGIGTFCRVTNTLRAVVLSPINDAIKQVLSTLSTETAMTCASGYHQILRTTQQHYYGFAW